MLCTCMLCSTIYFRAIVDHLTVEWSDTTLPEETFERAAALLHEPGEGAGDWREIVLREIFRIARFRVNG